jgi:hypothetical protein
MSHQQQHMTYPVTLVFNSVDGFLEAVQQRSIGEIGCATLKRIKPWEGGMFERHTSFLLLTARDHARDEVLTCSVYLMTADVANGDDLWTPLADWKRQQVRAEMVKHEVQKRLDAMPSIHVLDAAYHVHADVHMRFASLSPPVADDGNEGG